jgi:hypothetical protein
MPWHKLEQLRSCCEVKISSYLTRDQKLAWRVVVRPRKPNDEPIETSDPDDGGAIEKAFAEAERRGWVQRA